MMICGGHADEKQIFSKYHWKNHIVTGIFLYFSSHYIYENK